MADSPDRTRSYFISAGEATEGPFDLPTLRAQVMSGRIGEQYQIWDDDAGGWAPFSLLEELLRGRPEAPARSKPIRAPKNPSNPMRDSPEAGAATGGVALSEAELLGGIVPRVVSQRLGGTFAAEPPTPEPLPEKAEKEPAPAAEPEPAPSARRRIYSPMSAGANVARPYAPLRGPEEGEEAVVAEAGEPEPIDSPFADRPAEQRAVWSIAAVCVGICALALLALQMAGVVTFGVHEHEEHLRLQNELAAAREQVAAKEKALKTALVKRDEFLGRFTAAQVAVRNIRVSIFASTRRELRLGDGPGIDQRLFELDQLARLVPEDEAEQKVRHELTDAFFSFRERTKPSPPAEASPSPAP